MEEKTLDEELELLLTKKLKEILILRLTNEKDYGLDPKESSVISCYLQYKLNSELYEIRSKLYGIEVYLSNLK